MEGAVRTTIKSGVLVVRLFDGHSYAAELDAAQAEDALMAATNGFAPRRMIDYGDRHEYADDQTRQLAEPRRQPMLDAEGSVRAWRMWSDGMSQMAVACELGVGVASVKSAIRRVESGMYGDVTDATDR